MDKVSFAKAFTEAVEVACRSAERLLGRPLSRDVVVRMYGAQVNGLTLSPEDFVHRVYINDDLFYRLIDLMVIEVVGLRPVVFARVSSHSPAPLSECWNGDNGPFKQLLPHTITQS